MTAAERRKAACDARYTVWPSHWTGTGGDRGTSWVVTTPQGDNLEDYEGSEPAGWAAAYRHMRAACRAEAKAA